MVSPLRMNGVTDHSIVTLLPPSSTALNTSSTHRGFLFGESSDTAPPTLHLVCSEKAPVLPLVPLQPLQSVFHEPHFPFHHLGHTSE